MYLPLSNKERLQLLNEAQPERPWKSCAEKRRCVNCDRVFRGEDVSVCRSDFGAWQLACPKCGSSPALWVRLGNPLTQEEIWSDWESAMQMADSARDGEFEKAG
jgi:hypothetical protein